MSLFESLGGKTPPANNFQTMLGKFQQFKQTFTGDPRQQVQQLLNSGKISQSQLNQAVQMAQQLQKLLK